MIAISRTSGGKCSGSHKVLSLVFTGPTIISHVGTATGEQQDRKEDKQAEWAHSENILSQNVQKSPALPGCGAVNYSEFTIYG
jgi:hypothetical protein